jgi:hypothetical protein
LGESFPAGWPANLVVMGDAQKKLPHATKRTRTPFGRFQAPSMGSAKAKPGKNAKNNTIKSRRILELHFGNNVVFAAIKAQLKNLQSDPRLDMDAGDEQR